MRIVHLVAGAGGMYCGSCLHANTLVAALRQAGHEAFLVPLYTPLRVDEEDVSDRHLALGGINVYLHERVSWFRFVPRPLARLLDNRRLLRWIGRRGFSTRPESLGALTVSMLRGEEGRQRRELETLARWLGDHLRPEVIHLSNVMLSGTARVLGRRLRVPVVCSLSGEDLFLEKLAEPHYGEARAALRERAGELAALVAMNRYYADFMADYLSVPRERIHVVPPGLNLEGHGAGRAARRKATAEQPATIGFLARICPEKGLHLLAEAFALLAADKELPPTRLLAAGYLAVTDRPYLETVRSRLAASGLADRFRYVGELDRSGKITFLQSLDVMSTPTIYRESKGLPVLEAWANAVPVVLPAHGTFPEMVEDTGGGLLFEPGNAAELAAALKRMITEPDLARQCGRRGQEAVRLRYHAPAMAERIGALYESLRAGSAPDAASVRGTE